jgi:hypothetical protein
LLLVLDLVRLLPDVAAVRDPPLREVAPREAAPREADLRAVPRVAAARFVVERPVELRPEAVRVAVVRLAAVRFVVARLVVARLAVVRLTAARLAVLRLVVARFAVLRLAAPLLAVLRDEPEPALARVVPLRVPPERDEDDLLEEEDDALRRLDPPRADLVSDPPSAEAAVERGRRRAVPDFVPPDVPDLAFPPRAVPPDALPFRVPAPPCACEPVVVLSSEDLDRVAMGPSWWQVCPRVVQELGARSGVQHEPAKKSPSRVRIGCLTRTRHTRRAGCLTRPDARGRVPYAAPTVGVVLTSTAVRHVSPCRGTHSARASPPRAAHASRTRRGGSSIGSSVSLKVPKCDPPNAGGAALACAAAIPAHTAS